MNISSKISLFGGTGELKVETKTKVIKNKLYCEWDFFPMSFQGRISVRGEYLTVFYTLFLPHFLDD